MTSRIIYKGAHYTACLMRDGSLIVTSNRIRLGRRLVGEQVSEWVAAIESAMDKSEAHALCRAIIRGLI